MEHIFIKKNLEEPTLLLLHGTGGDEHSLVGLASAIAPNSSLLGIRGKVSEGGANRYFRRFSEGAFDLEDLEKQTTNLLKEVTGLVESLGINRETLVILGYSNGANIGAHLLLERENSFKRGLFFHPMSLGKHVSDFSLRDQKIWLSYGEADSIVPLSHFNALRTVFEGRGAETSVYRSPFTHSITSAEVAAAQQWFKELN